MLTRFSVKNYKNFKDEIELDFTNTRDYRYGEKCVFNGYLSKMIMMGTNGSGKTNFGYALFDIVMMLTDKNCKPEQKDQQSFLNCDSADRSATFKYEFEFDNDHISYEYHKTDPYHAIFETLSINDQQIFTFDKTSSSDFSNMEKIGAETLNMKGLDGTISVLRFVYNNTIHAKNSPISKMMDFVQHMLYFRSTQDGNSFIGFSKNGEIIEQYIMDNGLTKDFQKFLKDMANLDIMLTGFNVKGYGKIFVQDFGTKKIPFANIASSGSRALELFYYWMKKFDDISFLFIDEFDAFYHYEMSERVLVFLIENYPKMQMILTSHNTDLVNTDLMRPDCYLIIGNNEIRSLSDSTDRELRVGHNLEKMLRNGEFDERP